MGKSKRGRASSSLYTPGPLWLNLNTVIMTPFPHILIGRLNPDSSLLIVLQFGVFSHPVQNRG